MRRKKTIQNEALPFPGGLPPKPPVDDEPKTKALSHPLWTENKAKLIERYLLYFVFVTHHGTYIDGFAGPQEPDLPDMWAAKLVLDTEPKWLRNFHLFDIDPDQIKRLEKLKSEQPERDSKNRKVKRNIDIYEGDFNVRIDELLTSGSIGQAEATFCLLDQWSTQCHWSTVEKLARYKTEGNKIELFYFLAVGWLNRTIKAITQDEERLRLWWGRDDWTQFLGMKKRKQAEVFAKRIKSELGYKSVKYYPIFSKEEGSNVMYYMIHATDHPEAPVLMTRAYNRAYIPEKYEQLLLDECFSSSSEFEP
jgi:three-Cys-motif partner protein